MDLFKKAKGPKSCLECRKRKIKCDQKRPACFSCVAKNRVDQCIYSEPEWTIAVTNSNDDIVSVPSTETTAVVFHSNPPSISPIAGNNKVTKKKPTGRADMALLKQKDEEIKSLQDKIKQLQDALSIKNSLSNVTNNRNSDNNSNFSCQLDNKTVDYYQHLFRSNPLAIGPLSWTAFYKHDTYLSIPLTIIDSTLFQRLKLSKLPNQRISSDEDLSGNSSAIGIHLSNPNVIDIQTYFQTRILPHHSLIWSLVDQFFRSELYYQFPILLKCDFSKQLTQIIGSKNNPVPTIQIKSKNQLAIIGISLTIFRIIQITTTFNRLSFAFINISPEIISNIQALLSTYKQTSVIIFQFNLFATILKRVIGISLNLNELLQLALKNNLHRDPSTYSHIYNDQLLRTLWYTLVWLDYNDSLLIGTQPIINESLYDCELPDLSTSTDLNLRLYLNFIQYKDFLKAILNVRDKPVLIKVLNSINIIETDTQFETETFNKLFDDKISVIARQTKLLELTNKLTLLEANYHYLFLFYIENDLIFESFQSLIKLLKSNLWFFKITKSFLLTSRNSFGLFPAFYPYLELLILKCVKTLLMIQSRIVGLRIKGSKKASEKDNQQLFTLLSLITSTLGVIMRCVTTAHQNLPNDFEQRKIVSKAHIYFLSNIVGLKNLTAELTNVPTEDYELKYYNQLANHPVDHMFSSYNIDQFKEIYAILQQFLDGDEDSFPLNFQDLTTNDVEQMLWNSISKSIDLDPKEDALQDDPFDFLLGTL